MDCLDHDVAELDTTERLSLHFHIQDAAGACYCFSGPHGVAVGTPSCIISQAGRDPWEYLKENEPLPHSQFG